MDTTEARDGTDPQDSPDARPLLVDVAAGAVAGAAATLPMSVVMLLAQRLGLMGAQPPRRITDGGLGAVGAHPPGPARRALASLAHVGFGAAAGVPPVLLRRLLPGGARPHGLAARAAGAGYGLLVWASAYLGWVPAVGLMPPAHRDRRGRPASMVAAHVVYGWVLAAATERLTGGPGGRGGSGVRVPWAPTHGPGRRQVPGALRA